MLDQNKFTFDWVLWFQWMMATTLGWFLGGILVPGIGLLTSGIGIGVFQSFILVGWFERSWRWMIVTVIGWSAGWLINLVTVPAQDYSMNGIALGITTGLAQWLVIKNKTQLSFWWVIVTAVGWMSGIALFPGLILPGIVAGGVTGIALVLLLRVPNLRDQRNLKRN
jgi:hypothetical protein